MKDVNINRTPSSPRRLVFTVGLAIGLSILGDSFLYGNLPLEAENLGIALPLVGILLAANRIVRLISNLWASRVFERFGPRLPFISATFLALFTTALYGGGWGFGVFLLARLGWGISWSALRQGGYQAIWTGEEKERGGLMGLLWGIIRLGSAFGVLFGGYLRDIWGYGAGVFGVMTITALAVPIAFSIPWPREGERINTVPPSFRQGWQEAIKNNTGRRLLLAGSLHSTFEGIFLATASLFLAGRLGEVGFLSPLGIGVGTLAGVLLALRWMSDIIFAPAIGWLFDRLGQVRTLRLLAFSLVLNLSGVLLADGPLLFFCLCTLFISSAGLHVTLNALGNIHSSKMTRPHLFVGVFTTATDTGAALGPLLAYSLGALCGFDILYLTAGGFLTLAVHILCRKE